MVYKIEGNMVNPLIKEMRYSIKEFLRNKEKLLSDDCINLLRKSYYEYLNTIYIDNLKFSSIKMLYYASVKLYKDALYKKLTIERRLLTDRENIILDRTINTELFSVVEEALLKDCNRL